MAHREELLYTECSLYVDTQRRVEEGDVFVTSAGTCYRCVEIERTTDRGNGEKRVHMRVLRILASDVDAEQDRLHTFHWYKREKKKGTSLDAHRS